jgi:hypothetical protein
VQNATLWRALLGVEKTVVEDIEFDEASRCWWRMCVPGRGRGLGPSVVAASAEHLSTTAARDGVDGGRWTWARSRSCWRPTHPG